MRLLTKSRRAFTLVEVLIVVIILGILAAIVVPQFTDATTDAKVSSLTTNLQIIRGQLELYKIQHNDTYPALATFSNQMTLSSKADGTTAAVGTSGYDYGPYLQVIPDNPYSGANDVSEADPASDKGWYYNEDTGEFRGNDSAAHHLL